MEIPRNDPEEFIEYLKTRIIDGETSLNASRNLWSMYRIKFSEEDLKVAAKKKGYDVIFNPSFNWYELTERKNE